MKKILILYVVLGGLIYSGCKKRDAENISETDVVSYPSFTFTGSKFVSIPVGGTVPPIAVTAYDSVYNEVCSVQAGESTVDNTMPGLYSQQFISKNSKGFVSTAIAFVAVTDVTESADLSGTYKCVGRNGLAQVTELANGLYQTDNVGGNPTGPVPVYFVQFDDTTIYFPTQPTAAGEMSFTEVALSLDNPVTYQYKVINPGYGTGLRVFEKQ